MLLSTKVPSDFYYDFKHWSLPKINKSFIFLILSVLFLRILATLDVMTLSTLLTFLHYITLILVIGVHMQLLPSLELKISFCNAPDYTQSKVVCKVVTQLFRTLSQIRSRTSIISTPTALYHQQKHEPDLQNCAPSPTVTVVSSTTQTLPHSSISDTASQTDIPCPHMLTTQTLQDIVQKQGEELVVIKQDISSHNGFLKKLTTLIQHQQDQLQSMVSNSGDSKIFYDSELQSHLNKHQQTSHPSESVPCHPQRSTLKPLEVQSLSSMITKFDGDSAKYQHFKSRFCTIIDSLEVTIADKALVLYVSLEEQVLPFLGDITDTGALNYEKLWAALDYEFDPLHHGMFTHIAELFTISSMSQCDNSAKLMEFYKFIKKHYISLNKMGVGHEVEAFKIKILSKLCGSALDKVSSLILEADGQPVVPRLLDLLKEEISLLQLQEIAENISEVDRDRDKIQEEPTEPTSKHVIGADSLPNFPTAPILKQPSVLEHQERGCIFCETNIHHSHSCRKFRAPSEYKHVLFKQFLCFNCLNVGHKSYACPYQNQCSLCYDSRKHSPVLCTLNYKF